MCKSTSERVDYSFLLKKLSFTVDRDEEEEEVKLTAAEIKKYKARFSQSIIQFSKLQFNESAGEGIANIHVHAFHPYECTNPAVT